MVFYNIRMNVPFVTFYMKAYLFTIQSCINYNSSSYTTFSVQHIVGYHATCINISYVFLILRLDLVNGKPSFLTNAFVFLIRPFFILWNLGLELSGLSQQVQTSALMILARYSRML